MAWSRKFKNCIKCGTSERRHVARGLCEKCYRQDTELRQKDLKKRKEIELKLKGKQYDLFETNFNTKKADRLFFASKILTKKYLHEKYIIQKMSLSEIGKELGCTRQYVLKKIKQFGIPLRSKKQARKLALEDNKIRYTIIDDTGNIKEIIHQKININERFFSSWNPKMAYVLGFIFTDGCLHYYYTNKLGRLDIGQKEPEILIKILALMECDAKIYHKNKKVYKGITSGELYTIQILNNKIYTDLIKLGLKPQKSLDCQFPNVPQEYLRHFIRGCWDGDGSIGFYSGIYRAIFVSGSYDFIYKMQKTLYYSGLREHKIYEQGENQKNYSIQYCGTECRLLYHFLYDDVDQSQYLERKYLLFKEAAQKYYSGLKKVDSRNVVINKESDQSLLDHINYEGLRKYRLERKEQRKRKEDK